MMRMFGCRKFRRVSGEQGDRILSEREQMFLSRHRAVCSDCVIVERQNFEAMDMIRSIRLEAVPNPSFEERVLRRIRVNRTRESFRYWSPAIVGASIAGVAIIAALQIVAQTGELNVRPPVGNAVRTLTDEEALPKLLLNDLKRDLTERGEDLDRRRAAGSESR